MEALWSVNPPNIYATVYINQVCLFSYRTIKSKRDAYVKRLNNIYQSNLDKVRPSLYVSFVVFRAEVAFELPVLEMCLRKNTNNVEVFVFSTSD